VNIIVKQLKRNDIILQVNPF